MPALRHELDLRLQPGVELAPVVGGDRPSAPCHPVHRLAQLAHGASLQGERARVDEGLLADAHRVQPERPVGLQVRLGRAPQHDLPAASARLIPERGEHFPGGAGGRNRIGRDHRGAADHPVGEYAAGGEGQCLVGPQQERRQRIGAVRIDDRSRRPVLVLQMAVGGGGGADERAQGQHRDGRGARDEDVDEGAPLARRAGRRGHREGVSHRMVQDAGEDMTGGVPDVRRAEDRSGRQAPRAEGGERDRRARAIGAPQRERAATGGEHEREARLHDRLAQVTVAGVERRQRHEPDDGQRDGRARAAPQPRDERQQRGAEDQGQRMATDGNPGYAVTATLRCACAETPCTPKMTDCVASTVTDAAAVCRIDRNRICAPMQPFWTA